MTGKPQEEAAQRLKAAFAADHLSWQQQLRAQIRSALADLSERNHPPKQAEILAQILNAFSDLTPDAALRDLVADFVERLPYEMNRRRRHNMKVWEELQRRQEERRRDAGKPQPDE